MKGKKKFTNLSVKKQDESKTVKFFVDEANGVVVCRLYDRWYGNYFVGKTRCHDVDKYDEKRGRAIAFNKARKKELEFNLKCVARQRKELQAWYEREMKFLDKREAINEIYLAGALEDLSELMKVPVQSEVVQTYTEVAEENQQ